MATYEAYLENSDSGACMAHVPDLPGCFVAAADRERALARLPAAIQAYLAHLQTHGESWDMPQSIEVAVVEEKERSGPFHPDDRAALFEHDRRPLSRDEIERYLDLAAYNRADLLALVRGLSNTMLAWRPRPEAMSIGRILAHIGRAELWYISRITEVDASAPDWRELPGRQFLTLARDMLVECFRGLSDEQLTAVTHPPISSGANREPWTARKALRRMLEHEREHAAHIEEVLFDWRKDLMARLAATRSSFVWQLVALDEETLKGAPLFNGETEGAWTAKDIVAHVAAWDELYGQRTGLVGQGRAAEITSVDLETRNAVVTEERRDWTLDEAVKALNIARDDYLVALGGLSDRELHRRYKLPWGTRTAPATWARWRFRHDDRHTKDLLKWRDQAKPRPAAGPKAVLQAALESGRSEMLATAALVSASERQTRPVCGVWTLKDVLGHVADWEWYGVEKLDGPPSRRSLDIRFRGIQDWNEAHAAARKDQPWDEVWSDFQAARLAMGQLLEKMSQDDLAQPFTVPWSRKWTVYRWIHLWLHHEREHAADLRDNLDLPRWPRRLKHFG